MTDPELKPAQLVALESELDRRLHSLVGDLSEVSSSSVAALGLAVDRMLLNGDTIGAKVFALMADRFQERLDKIASRGKQ